MRFLSHYFLPKNSCVVQCTLFTAAREMNPHQGGEPYPTEAIIDTFANKARGGAAIVTLTGTSPRPMPSDGNQLSYDIPTGHTESGCCRSD